MFRKLLTQVVVGTLFSAALVGFTPGAAAAFTCYTCANWMCGDGLIVYDHACDGNLNPQWCVGP